MIKFIDNLLSRITMYRLALYYLIFLVAVAAALSFFGYLPFGPIDIAVSAAVLVFACWIANNVFAKAFKVPANAESLYITALILALIITPRSPSQYFFTSGLAFLIWVSVWAMASKYIVAVRKKHIFNPAAFAVALTALTINQAASWWVGTLVMLPFTLFGGLLVARKTARFDLVLSFLAVALAMSIGFGLMRGTTPLTAMGKTLVETPIIFFAFVMLTEPLTTPPAKPPRILYGAITGFLFTPALHFGSVYSTPELALLAGNLFSRLVSPKGKYVLKLVAKNRMAPDIYDFAFASERRMKFKPGQYLEWTLGHPHPDSRGNRRYFTIASSPEEREVRLGVKFYPDASSFKKSMLAMRPGDEILASQLSGDFTLPRDKRQKLVFVAGGIGITPFRSIIKHLLAQNEQRTITVLYSSRTLPEVVYMDILEEARERLRVKTVYTLTDEDRVPSGWRGAIGRIDAPMIIKTIPDYYERVFYLSGPRSLVVGFEEVLKSIGIPRNRIKTDFFPGFT